MGSEMCIRDRDYIAVARQGESEPITLTRTSPQGSPLNLHMPAEIGDYEIRYVLHDGYKTIATRLISVVERDLSIDSVESVDSPAYAEMIG